MIDVKRTLGAALAALFFLPVVSAIADTHEVQILDERITDAKRAAAAASAATNVICGNTGYAMAQRDLGRSNNANEQIKQCLDAMQASSDALGLIGYLYEQRSHLTGEPLSAEYACSGKPSLGAPHPDANGHYNLCPKDPDEHSSKFWIITQVRMQAGNAKETWSDGGILALHRFDTEDECRAGIARYEDYPSRVPYNLTNSVMIGDVCVQVLIPDVRELSTGAR